MIFVIVKFLAFFLRTNGF